MIENFWLSAFDFRTKKNTENLLPHSMPFWLKDNKNDVIVICLHGWTATTYEVKSVGEAIFQSGIDSSGPLLPGHGCKSNKKAKKELNLVKYIDWLKATRHEIYQAKKIYKKIFIYGQSMGGALALSMASEGLVDCCAVTAPAIKLPGYVNLFAPILGFLNLHRRKKDEKDYFNEEYSFESFKSVNQLLKLAKYCQKNLEKITCPILVCHSQNDNIIDPIVPEIIKEKSSGSVEIAWFNKSGHSMTLDVQGKEIAEKISRFFIKQLG